ncbi:Hint domain-containing protein [Seohaeicola saemankumensis]|nr:Hint domain-containing protein [Seohaeicola saemankumensis]MCA0872395.1 Hint domain-containing protein [Seohaeicola saemankumensis]
MPPETGFVTGTIVLTMDGEMPVEFLSPGDRVITRDSGMARLQTIARSTRRIRVVSIAAGSLGDTRPDQDLILPAAQQVLIRDWRAKAMFNARQALVRAEALIDGEFIRDLGEQDITLHQLRFAGSHIVYAGGLELAAASDHTAGLRPAA